MSEHNGESNIGDEDNDILNHARRALFDGNADYAKFLYREALDIDPQDNTVRAELHKLRAANPPKDSFVNTLQAIWCHIKIFIKQMLSRPDDIIKLSEELLDIDPNNTFAIRNIMAAATAAGYNKLVIFISDKILSSECSVDDMAVIANAYLSEKIFDKAAKIAKEATEIDPQNEELKEILWKSSVEKHMNTDVKLVTANKNQFVPPKVDTNKIFISSHKDDTKDDKTKNDKDKPPATP